MRKLFSTVAVLIGLVGILAACQPALGGISGQLTSAGQPAAGARVSVFSSTSETLLTETWADGDGNYTLSPTVVPPGTYRVRFDASQWWSAAPDWASATPVSVDDDGLVLDTTLTTVGSANLSGTASSPSGPTAGITVVAVNATTTAEIATTTTDPTGTYTLTVAPGPYVLRFSRDGLATTWSGSSATRTQATPVVVADGDSSPNNDATLPVQALLTGTVAPNYFPVGDRPQVTVLVFSFSEDELVASATTVNGSYSIPGLRPGSYRLLVVPDGSSGFGLRSIFGTTAVSQNTPIYGRDCPNGGYIEYASPGPDHHGQQLMGCGFSGIGRDLSDADLRGSDFRSGLSDSNLSGADLRYSSLSGSLVGVDITGADFSGATTSRYQACSCGIGGTYYFLSGKDLVGIPAGLPTGWSLHGGVLFGAGTSISDVSLAGLDLQGVSLVLGRLTNVDLSGADLTGADLRYATLTNTDLTNAVLTNADISGGNFTGATLTGVTSGGVAGTGVTLPTGWSLVDGFLVGPPGP